MLFGKPVTTDIPRPVKTAPDKLKSYAGTFQFGDDYFVKNAVMKIEAAGDHLNMINTANGFTIGLLPIEGDRFFDRIFWSFVRFEGDKLIYRNGDRDYVATRR